MKFSILLCTRNSERLISEVIQSIINQIDLNDILEIIIVDYKSTDATLRIARELLFGNKIALVEIKCMVGGKSPALILGMNAASGDFIVIVDDDNVLFNDYIFHAKQLLKNDKIGCVGAKGVVDDNLILPDWFPEYQGIYAIGMSSNTTLTDWVWGAGSIIRKEAWNRLRAHRFQLVLNPIRLSQATPITIGGEDVELALAIKLIGYEVVISEKLKFIHKFEQSRLTENYLIKNSLGVSKSAPVHDIYRMVIYYPNILFPIFFWQCRVFINIIGCSLRFVKNYFKNNSLNRKFNMALLIGITTGFFKFNAQFKKIHAVLMELKNSTNREVYSSKHKYINMFQFNQDREKKSLTKFKINSNSITSFWAEENKQSQKFQVTYWDANQGYSNLPLISIITSNLNSGTLIEKTLDFVKNCDYPLIEYIVVDGASSDCSLDIILKSKSLISKLISERDGGIYDAWNKGVRVASGEYIAFLGAGDVYVEGGLSKLVDRVLADRSIDFVSSKISIVSSNMKLRQVGKPWAWKSFRRIMNVAHPGALHSRRLFDAYGEFDSSYRIAGDYEFLLRANHSLNAAFIDEVTVYMVAGGISQSDSRGMREVEASKLKHGVVPVWVARFDRYCGQFKKFIRVTFL